MRDRRPAESSEQVLQQQMRDQLDAESQEKMEARLQQTRDRLAVESEEHRATAEIRDRLAAESADQRDSLLRTLECKTRPTQTRHIKSTWSVRKKRIVSAYRVGVLRLCVRLAIFYFKFPFLWV